MGQEPNNLKDELARVRAREKRFKDSAEAQISSLQQQLEAMTAAKNRTEEEKNELEIRCRQLKEEIKRLSPHEKKENASHASWFTDERPLYEILSVFFEGKK